MIDLLDTMHVECTSVELDRTENGEDLKSVLFSKIKSTAIPQIFIGRFADC